MSQEEKREGLAASDTMPDGSKRAFLVYAPARFQYSACMYYRQEVPLRGIRDFGLGLSFLDRGRHETDHKMTQAVLHSLLTSDINLFYAQSDGAAASLVETIQGMKAGRDEDGTPHVPPSVVYDIDDNLDWVHPFNHSFAIYGTRDRRGRLLKPGENVTVPLADGSKTVLWEDKVTVGEKQFVFDIERNAKFLQQVHTNAARYDGFTCPSPHLASYLREHYGYPEPYVFPNSLILKDHFFPRIAPHEGVRILWQGGGSHSQDWYPLRGAIRYIAKKYPQVTFVLWGTKYPWITDVIPESQLEYYGWEPFDAYKPMRHALGIDINLCPLSDDEFGRSKSCIKWYEGSIGPTPEATLAADCLPYNAEIVDGETGLLYKACPGTPSEAQQQETEQQFAANLEELINNLDLRKRLAENARAWVYANRLYEKTVPALFNDYWVPLREKKAREVEWAESPKKAALIEVPFVHNKKPAKMSRAKRKAATEKAQARK